jgi:arylformamidase
VSANGSTCSARRCSRRAIRRADRAVPPRRHWQVLDRSWVSHCARGLNARGVAVAISSHDLCPSVALSRIVGQVRAAAGFLYRRHGRRLLTAGHSAAGHFAATLMATDWRAHDPALPADLVPAGLPVSGVFELEPLLPTTIARALRLDAAAARALSPRWLPAPRGGALHAVVGGAERAEFIRQTRDFAAAWGGTWEALPGANHFTVLRRSSTRRARWSRAPRRWRCRLSADPPSLE